MENYPTVIPIIHPNFKFNFCDFLFSVLYTKLPWKFTLMEQILSTDMGGITFLVRAAFLSSVPRHPELSIHNTASTTTDAVGFMAFQDGFTHPSRANLKSRQTKVAGKLG